MGVGLESVARDVRVALRGWIRAPGFAAAAVTTLALGIGANTAVFSAFYAVMVRPLPFKDSDRVVYLRGGPPMVDIPQLRAASKTLSSISVLVLGDVSVGGVRDGETVELRRAVISPSAFELLDVQPAIGRLFAPRDEDVGAEPVVMISYAAWQEQFGADPHLLGRRITIAGYAQTIVGVMPRGFAFPSPDVQMWNVAILPAARPGEERSPQGATTIARVNRGVSLEAAAAELNTLFVGLHPEAAQAIAHGAPPLTLLQVKEQMVAPVRTALLVLAAAAALVLFIACSNVAWLLLARANRRRNDIGVRIALGAGTGRVLREVLTESVMLALSGGLVGTLLAVLGLQFLRVFHGNTIPRLAEVNIDAAFLLISVASSVVTVAVSGVLPGLRIARFRLVPVGRAPTAHGGAGGLLGRKSASVLTIAQVSSAVVLLIAAGLLLRSFAGLARLDLGYEPADVLTCEVRLPPNRYSNIEQSRILSQLSERLGAVPGVVAVAATSRLPTQPGGVFFGRLQLPEGGGHVPVNVTPASATYLNVMRLRVAAGRWFDDRDRHGGETAIVVSRQVAASFASGRATDSVVQLNGPFDGIPLHVVGVVDDTFTGGPDGVARPDIYMKLDQWPATLPLPLRSLIGIRHNGSPAELAPTVRILISQVEPSLSADHIVSMQDLVSRSTERPLAYATLLGAFAVVAVVIALVGIYGFVAYIVSARTYEIGVRMALGARQAQIMHLVLGYFVTVTVTGVVLGLVAAAAVTRYLQAMLFGLTPLDAMTFAAVPVSFMAVAILAAYGPTRRATRVDPLVSLRSE